jgi:hypothetical protein
MNDPSEKPRSLVLPPDSWARMEMLRALHQHQQGDLANSRTAGLHSRAVSGSGRGQNDDRRRGRYP